jgi:DNA-directed RNA polymerase subunit N (RpoN/RPB10)
MNLSPEDFIRFIGARGFHQFPIRCQCGKVFSGAMTDAIIRGVMREQTLVESASKLRMSADRKQYFAEGDSGYSSSLPPALDRICCRTSIIAVELHYFADDQGQEAVYQDEQNDFTGYPPELAIEGESLEISGFKEQLPQTQFDVLRRVMLLIEPGMEEFPLPIVWELGDEIGVFQAR